jgi:hypothetical protein
VFFLSKEKKRMITSRGVGGKKKAVNIDDRAQDRHTRFGAGGGTISTTHQFPFLLLLLPWTFSFFRQVGKELFVCYLKEKVSWSIPK